MSRIAKYQLKQVDRERISAGMPIRLNTFGSNKLEIRVKSLQNVNPDAWHDHLFELRVENKRIILSASELLQALQSV